VDIYRTEFAVDSVSFGIPISSHALENMCTTCDCKLDHLNLRSCIVWHGGHRKSISNILCTMCECAHSHVLVP